MGLRQTGGLARVAATVATTDISARSTRNLTLGGQLASEIFWTAPAPHPAPGQGHVISPRWGAAFLRLTQDKAAPLQKRVWLGRLRDLKFADH
jgi:hypothetical protein